ncbi:DUF4157 domain-containing protein [Acidiferrimicrobium sp. IK]|uniref:eCIS core domain-containing protein n=1 Tax=Acidiferrimicrobium sp. IK TaxID=2871700 RepID=UPI0021CB5968|nr:DUF4157 domain-containing protein [Acidiferrimicrobium sp. IK]MCU4182955.1 DUF4157 domain-containing protein [Acidiferrimicrobium sp. IK]
MREVQPRRAESAEPAPAKPAPAAGPGAGLLGLQARAGNRATGAIIQASLEVGAADDTFEREAESVAAEVVRRLARGGTASGAARTAAGRDGAELARRVQRVRQVQRRAAAPSAGPVGPEGGELDDATARAVERARGGGSPLERGAQREMESAFGADFSAVRVHQGAEADLLNRKMGARAFTVGSDIFFRGGAPSLDSDGGRHLLAHELTHTLQQGASAARALQRAGNDSEEAEEEASEAEVEESGDAVTAGVVPDSKLTESSQEIEGPPPGIEADRSGARIAPSSPAPSGSAPRSTAGRWRVPITVAGLDVDSSVERSSEPPRGGDSDAIVPKAKVGTEITGGFNPSPFGAINRGFVASSTDFKSKTGKKGSSLTLSAKFTQKVTWGTSSGGHTDIASASSPAVTAATYKEIAADLTPALTDASWVAPRQTYWSQKLCERHEKFHAKDVQKWASGQGKTFAADYLSKKTIDLNDSERKDPAKIQPKVQAIVNDTTVALQNAVTTYMRGVGNTYYNYPGEIRAFGDGKDPYLKLAAAVTKKGAALEKAEAKAKAKTDKAKAKPDNATVGAGA